MMSDDDINELAMDITKDELRLPVTVWTDRETGTQYLVDGRNRLEANQRLGYDWHKVLRKELHRDDDPYTFVISANIRRRHLTADQKRDLVAKVLKAQPEKSDRQIATQAKVDHKTVGTQRKKLEATGEIPQSKTRTGADGKARKQPARSTRRSKPKTPPKKTPTAAPTPEAKASDLLAVLASQLAYLKAVKGATLPEAELKAVEKTWDRLAEMGNECLRILKESEK
jgi:ParB/Sulfiredoxin domain